MLHSALPALPTKRRKSESGNMFVYILGAIFLMGILVVISKGNMQEGVGIDAERATLAAARVQRYAGEIASGVNAILDSGFSETQLRFADPDNNTGPYGDISTTPKQQVFSPDGGNVEYQKPIDGINDGTPWQFYANTHIKDIGTDTAATRQAELLAVLPNVTKSFCAAVNLAAKQTINLTLDTDPASNGCVYGGTEFNGTYLSGSGVNTLDDTKFSLLPAPEACVRCATDGKFHYYRVLLSR
ncbi:MAG: hypothetical protein DI626_02995 [Micavibrio aeruginosavorus]|uniref:Uncharacterized protein n=1 Tax=Micavibrio aeruginosavorus TaxID=349221 RepID=A0A2W4ZZZ7_9BACT|nr:MAG: hypothetical protein DI626_02995 [Micavibrio aeruginosavorus]